MRAIASLRGSATGNQYLRNELLPREGGWSWVGEITIRGKRTRKGDRMTKGNGWRLLATKRRKRVFAGTLIWTFNFGEKRLAVFNLPKRLTEKGVG